jgi:hypothetical protein
MAAAGSAILAALLAAAFAQQNPQAVIAFLQKHQEPLDLADGGSRFEARLLDTNQKQVFLLGENHGIAINDELDLAMLRYLHRNAGVRVYLGEFGYAAGCLLNEYLASGDERVLDFVMQASHGSVGWTVERRAFFANLRRWNQTLPPAERVRFVGVDVEHQWTIALRYMAELAKRGGTPAAAIAPLVAKLSTPALANGNGLVEFTKELSASLREHHADYAALLGDKLSDFELVARNLDKNLQTKAIDPNSKEAFAIRENAMYDTFRQLYPRFQGVKVYGRFGTFHVLQRSPDGRGHFAAMLNGADSPVAGKVVSIISTYWHSEAMTQDYHKEAVATDRDGEQLFGASTSAPLTLFQLTGADSPFNHEIAGFLGTGSRGVPTEYAQYLLYIRNAAASRPLEAGKTAIDAPPVVVKTVPAAGSADLPAELTDIQVTFSKEMSARSYSWCRADGFDTPNLTDIHFLDGHRTVAAKAKLEPGRTYAVWVNWESYQNFKDAQGHPAVPYLLVFQTK